MFHEYTHTLTYNTRACRCTHRNMDMLPLSHTHSHVWIETLAEQLCRVRSSVCTAGWYPGPASVGVSGNISQGSEGRKSQENGERERVSKRETERGGVRWSVSITRGSDVSFLLLF